MRNFREYEIWKESMLLAKNIYFCTNKFPKHNAIANQMQRAAISIPSNIAEGASRKSPTEFARFLEIAIGSAFELETQIELSHSLNHLNKNDYTILISNIISIEKKISTLISKIRNSQQPIANS